MAEDTKPAAPTKKGKKPSPMLAYRLWLEAGRPSLRDLEKLLAAKGYSVDNSTLCRWKDKNPQWTAQMADKNAAIDPVKVILLIQKDKSVRMSGPDKLVRKVATPDLSQRVKAVRDLLVAVKA